LYEAIEMDRGIYVIVSVERSGEKRSGVSVERSGEERSGVDISIEGRDVVSSKECGEMK
jgi:hypothetical protein